MTQLPFLYTIHNTYISVTKDYIHPLGFPKVRVFKTRKVPKNKVSFRKRNSRIIQIGHGYLWSTFITLTLDSSFDFEDYDKIQSLFRSFLKKLYNLTRVKTGSYPTLTTVATRRKDGKIIKQLKVVTRYTYKTTLKYLAVMEHGKKTNRVHYHMLTNIDFANTKFFEFSLNYEKLISLGEMKEPRKVCPLWSFGWSDVVPVENNRCNSVYYLAKYLSKKAIRTPIGKREVFSSKGLNTITRVVGHNLDHLIDNYEQKFRINKSIIYFKKQEKKV
jgi:hypothetical protein